MDPSSHVAVCESDDICTVELARPNKLNALTPAMVEALCEAFDASERSARGVLITGQGRATCAGMDTEIVTDDYQSTHADIDTALQTLYRRIETYPAPSRSRGTAR